MGAFRLANGSRPEIIIVEEPLNCAARCPHEIRGLTANLASKSSSRTASLRSRSPCCHLEQPSEYCTVMGPTSSLLTWRLQVCQARRSPNAQLSHFCLDPDIAAEVRQGRLTLERAWTLTLEDVATTMTVSQLATQAGVSPDSSCYYERATPCHLLNATRRDIESSTRRCSIASDSSEGAGALVSRRQLVEMAVRCSRVVADGPVAM